MVLLETAVGQIPDLKQQTRLLLKLGEKNIMEKLKDQAREECIFQLQIINHKIFHLSLSVKIITRSLHGTTALNILKAIHSHNTLSSTFEKKIKKKTHLDHTIPATRNNDGVVVVGRKPDTGHPVSVTIFLDGVLALSKGVPQFDGLVS